jgi:DNA-binding CsgD family transcriptional regulator/tetratricopeptide (TPR) repeat protein
VDRLSQADLITAGEASLRAGEWNAARQQFQQAVDLGENAQALEGLSTSTWWLNQIDAAIGYRQRAFSLHKSEGRLGKAAFCAVWIGAQYFAVHANMAAAEGWMAVGQKLLVEAGPCPELARLMVMQTAISSDWRATIEACGQAREMARALGDRDCEVLADSYIGLARVSAGEVREGLGELDAAMALCTAGEVDELWIVGLIYCAMLAACERAADFARADQWCSVGGFVDRYRESVFSAACRACYGATLAARGRWEAAEQELLGALRSYEEGPRNQRIDALGRLAALRVLQGRPGEATRLLEGFEDHPDAAVAMAGLELGKGHARQAVALLERRLASFGDPNTQSAPMLSMLIDALLAAGETTRARAAADQLAALASRAAGRYLPGLAALAAGLVTAAEGRDPLPELESALDHLTHAEMPLEAGVARLAIARALQAHDPDLAANETRRALITFERLGAVPQADAASALLHSLGGPRRTGPKSRVPLSRREGQVLELLGLGLSNDELAARLFISRRTAEHHVSSILAKLELKGRAEATAYAVRHGNEGRIR